MNKEGKKYLLGLDKFSKFGPIRLKKIKNYFSDWESAFSANFLELKESGIEKAVIEEFLKERKDIDINQILEELEKENIKTITIEDDIYPRLLLQIFNPPQILYYKGNINFEEKLKLAVVGSRKCTHYGKDAINSIIPLLSRNDVIIVSGLALGIDSLAQQKTLEEGGTTISVIGSGLDRASIYPRNNLLLSDMIIKSGGGIISEFSPGTAPLKQNFPQRNRIISGISHGTLVVEASLKSGSLITSRYALEQGREIFAVPGSIYSSTSIGPNNLIKLGARACTKAEDILEVFGIESSMEEKIQKENLKNITEEEKKILNYISKDPIHVNELIQMTKLDIKTINSTLSILEIKKIIKNIGNSKYTIN